MSSRTPVVFIVEDDAAFNKLISSYIKAESKCDVHSYLSGEDCLEKISKNPDVILMDYELPFRDGIEVMGVIKKKLPNAIFIFLSGQTNIKIAVEALSKGAFDYIVKDHHAKENALNKIIHALRIKKLEKSKKHNELIIKTLLAILALSWLISFLYLIRK